MLTKALSLLATAASAAAMINCVNLPGLGLPAGGGEGIGGNTTFLDIHLWDSFGDGWDTAFWVLQDPVDRMWMLQSTCDKIDYHTQVNPCAHGGEGSYYMTVRTPDGELPEGWWEMVWTVQPTNPDGTPAGALITGTYNSTMVWYYDQDTDTWTLRYSDNLVTDFDCDGCSGGKCKPKPKPTKKGKDDDKDSKGSKGKGPMKGKNGDGSDTSGTDGSGTDGSGTDGSGTSSGSSAGHNETESPYKYGPRAVNLKVNMFSKDGNGWVGNSLRAQTFGFGAHWYISDYTQKKLFDDGSLCSGWSGSCEICLGDGSYVFRVSGPTFNETQEEIWEKMLGLTGSEGSHAAMNVFKGEPDWGFCHTKGYLNDQLNFHVKKGQCIPDDLRWADEICDNLANSTITVVGYVALGGITSEVFSASDAALVVQGLAAAVQGWEASSIMVLSTGLGAQSLSAGRRGLSSFTHEVAFSVTFIAEKFGVDGTKFANVENLVSQMASSLSTAFSAGSFGMVVHDAAVLAHNDILAEETLTAQLLSLEVSGIAYSGSKLVYYYDAAETVDSSVFANLNGSMWILVGAVAGLALVALVGVGVHSYSGSKYSKLANASEHDEVTSSIVMAARSSSAVPKNFKRALPGAQSSVAV